MIATSLVEDQGSEIVLVYPGNFDCMQCLARPKLILKANNTLKGQMCQYFSKVNKSFGKPAEKFPVIGTVFKVSVTI